MRILFVTLSVPFPPNNGHRMRNYLFLRALAAEGHQISVVSFADQTEIFRGTAYLDSICHTLDLVETPEIARNGSYRNWGRLQALYSPRPYGAWRFESSEIRNVLTRRLSSEEYGLVICDGIYQIQNIPRESPPIVLSEHTVTHEALDRYLNYETSPLKTLYGRLEYWKVRRWELRACTSVASVIACSERDREILVAACPDADVSVAPNCIDIDVYAPSLTDDGVSLLFVGAMDWAPNPDAVRFFVTQILPKVRKSFPAARFVVAGRNPSPAFVKEFTGVDGVRFTGTLPDLRPVLAEAAVSVVPLRSGSGTRIKILESAAMGKAIVSTSLGAEGLHYVGGKEIEIADDPTAFATLVVNLLRNRGQRRVLGSNARQWVENHYSLSAMRASLIPVLAAIRGPLSNGNRSRASA
jgi:polysaccharide biosynthesis protein PslH